MCPREWGKETAGDQRGVDDDSSGSTRDTFLIKANTKGRAVLSLWLLWFTFGVWDFFLLLTSLLSLFPFSLPAFIFLPASSKSPRWFNASLSAFDLLSEGRFVRARAVSFAVAVCFPWTHSAACGCFFSILHSWCVSLPLQDETEAKGEPGKVDQEQVRKEEGSAERPAGIDVRRVVGNVLALATKMLN